MSNTEESAKNFHRSKMFREKVTAGLDSRLDAQEELLELVLQNLRWPIIITDPPIHIYESFSDVGESRVWFVAKI